MPRPYVLQLFGSNWCKAAFVLWLILSYFLIPQMVFAGLDAPLAYIFMLVFALTMTCTTRNIKEKVVLARIQGSSILGIIASVVGLSGLQACGIGMPFCGASMGVGFLSLFPGYVLTRMHAFAIPIIITSIVVQVASLYFMHCLGSGLTSGEKGI